MPFSGSGEAAALQQLLDELDALCAVPAESPGTTLIVYPPALFPPADGGVGAPDADTGGDEEEGIPDYCPNFEGIRPSPPAELVGSAVIINLPQPPSPSALATRLGGARGFSRGGPAGVGICRGWPRGDAGHAGFVGFASGPPPI